MGRLKSDPLLQVVVVLAVLLVAAIVLTPLTMAQSGGLFLILSILSIPGRGDSSETPEVSDTEGPGVE